jgi:hypothetical protein
MDDTHELKIRPEYFEAVVFGRKGFEIRKNDRGFKVGEWLHLMEWEREKYTGRDAHVQITYVTDFMQRDGYVVLGIR